ncbi:hypothetical protein CP533_6008 [Ophiocordyceps camponoti-saundersi (nom. inval.)]|nr:hypothetical protein CP533_6008 [Ophiocordyceps camponoti-saundersi (nom. inval.)]
MAMAMKTRDFRLPLTKIGPLPPTIVNVSTATASGRRGDSAPAMGPAEPLPYSAAFSSADEYVYSLLSFAHSNETFQILCGGVHILDFFTMEPGLFHTALPAEWHPFLLSCETMRLLDLLVRDDLDELDFGDGVPKPPASLVRYIQTIRGLSLRREFDATDPKLPALPRSVAVGMKPKKIHEVTHFADYVQRLADDIQCEGGVSHVIDFGSGQNYLGRTLASDPYNRRVIAIEGRETNVAAAQGLDRLAGMAVKQKVMRNKKLWNKVLEVRGPDKAKDPEALAEAIKQVAGTEAFDFRPVEQLASEFRDEDGRGHVQYVSGRLDSGHLNDVVAAIDGWKDGQKPRLMAVSIHSCGNLSHHGIRSLVLNPEMRAVAMIGCCYNLMTERLGPPSYKHPYLRPSLQAINGRVVAESAKHDPSGFPMSRMFCSHGGDGMRLNITARMMACQALPNWTQNESEAFFTRHFYRAILQRIFLDRGVVSCVRHRQESSSSSSTTSPSESSPFNTSTNPVTIGSLSKRCYTSLRAYVRGAVEKLTIGGGEKQYASVLGAKMNGLTDEEVDAYEMAYLPRRRELCVVWSLMAFSAMVVESLIVTDRWMFLVEQTDIVERAWVEAVFDYRQSPRNLVVVGDHEYTLIYIPLPLYSRFVQPILRILLPQTQSLIDGSNKLEGLTADSQQHGFLNISVTPLEVSVVAHSSWARKVLQPVIDTLPRHLAGSVAVLGDDYMVLCIISADLEAAGRVIQLSSPLALAGVPIFFVTTYFSDFILFPKSERRKVIKALSDHGFELSEENQSNFVSKSPSSPPSNADELQVRTFELLQKRSVAPYVDEDLRLVQCSGRDVSQLVSAYGSSRQQQQRPHRRQSWIENVDSKLYTCIISALVSQPRFLSVTLAQDDPPSLLLDRKLLPLFGDSIVGDTDLSLVPIFLDLANLPSEVTGIVCGVAGRLVDEMHMTETSQLSYLSTARAGAVILAEEQATRALAILRPLLVRE